MNKLILIILMCMCSPGTGANKLAGKDNPCNPATAQVAEPMELFNPFLLYRN